MVFAFNDLMKSKGNKETPLKVNTTVRLPIFELDKGRKIARRLNFKFSEYLLRALIISNEKCQDLDDKFLEKLSSYGR